MRYLSAVNVTVGIHPMANHQRVDAPAFPGWQSFGDMITHFKFVKSHEQQIGKVAVVSDSGFASIMPHVVRHFIHADIRHFSCSEKVQALAWLNGK